MTDLPPEIDRLECELEALGWSKAEFQRKLRIRSQVYNNWRRRGIPVAWRIKISAVLGKSHEWLLAEEFARKQQVDVGMADKIAPTPAANRVGEPTAPPWGRQDLVESLISPRAQTILMHIVEATAKHRLSEDDLVLLQQIANRFMEMKQGD